MIPAVASGGLEQERRKREKLAHSESLPSAGGRTKEGEEKEGKTIRVPRASSSTSKLGTGASCSEAITGLPGAYMARTPLQPIGD